MKLGQKGSSRAGLVIIVFCIALLVIGAWALLRGDGDADQQTNQDGTPVTTRPDVSPVATWSTYSNAEFGFSFSYPAEWGDVVASEPHFGSEKEAGPRIGLSFSGCPECAANETPQLGASTPEVAINSKDFGGIGTSRLLALEAGYKQSGDDSYTVYSQANTEVEYSPANTLEVGLIGQALFLRQNDGFSNLDTSRAIANIDGGEYSGISFIIHDVVGETVNADLLKSMVQTLTLN